MFFINQTNKQDDAAFPWGISAMNVLRKLNHYEDLLLWINKTKVALDSVISAKKPVSKHLIERQEGINKGLKSVLELSDDKIEKLDEIKETAKDVYEKFNQYIWSEVKPKK